jgi:hypothetical protein
MVTTANPIQFGWQEWREATQQARSMASDDIHLQPQQHERQQSATASHQFYRVQPYKAGASYTSAGVYWKML